MSESFVLRTYPYREADLIVSFFTRDQGKLRGIARRARKPKSTFGSGLERLSHATVSYYQKENRELVNLNSCELVHSQFSLGTSFEASLGLDYMAELSEQLLPAGEANEKHFRLLMAVLDHLRNGGNLWQSLTYFVLWSVRLAGFLPEMRVAQDSLAIAREMLTTPVTQLAERPWSKETTADLRRFLVRQVEEHVERRLLTPSMLEAL
jgi:DNA repair protein RecO (recombination protein O)